MAYCCREPIAKLWGHYHVIKYLHLCHRTSRLYSVSADLWVKVSFGGHYSSRCGLVTDIPGSHSNMMHFHLTQTTKQEGSGVDTGSFHIQPSLMRVLFF